jgi:hypothetical protein
VSRKPDLTPEEADEIRVLFLSPEWSIMGLARSYGVNPATIRAVLNRTGAYARQPPAKPGDKR